ncbi:MAG: exodeoxyribonuclease VII large subunit [Candidatus Eiseniibacteriota bacterium]
MTASVAPPLAGRNLPEFTVSELSAALKRTVEDNFAHVRVRGEISGFKRHSSGHLYMALKDADAVLDAVVWRGTAGRLGLKPEDGMEVIATGRLTTYPGRSKYQIVIEAMELAGEGALLKLLEDRRKKLAAEGLFDAERKKPLPFLPEVIGVVTSPTGAVIRDILHRLRDRFPRHVLLWPVAVQGEGAAAQVAAAIEGFNALKPGGRVPRPDLLIVARGGGSLEDLWAFNEEIVVRAAAASAIPLISAVGHETDTTLIDFAADRRAPTPTAAAEMAVPVRAELLADVIDHERRMIAGWARFRDEKQVRLEGLARGLPDPKRLLEAAMQRLDDRAERLVNAQKTFLARRADDVARIAAGIRKSTLQALVRQSDVRLGQSATRLKPAVTRLLADLDRRLGHAGALLDSYSYERVLERGFALVSDPAGHPVTTASALSVGMAVGLRFRDGAAEAEITGTGRAARSPEAPKPAQPKPAKAKSAKARPRNGRQGSLL